MGVLRLVGAPHALSPMATPTGLARDLIARALGVLDADPRHDELEIIAMLLRDALTVLSEHPQVLR